MQEEDKEILLKESELFKGLEILRKASWESFDKRRTYEWKVSLALWTALAVFTGTVLTQPQERMIPLRGCMVWSIVIIFGALVLLIHIMWNIGIARSSNLDKEMSYVPRNKMYAMVGISYEKEIKPIIEESSKYWRAAFLSPLTQVGITLLLVLAAWSALYLRAN